MSSQVDIVNAAFVKIGVPRIVTMLDDVDRAELALAIYADQRQHVLRDHPWNFAIKRASLAALAAAPEWGFTYKYQLPGDCLRVLETSEDVDGGDYEWFVEGRVIVTDLSPPLLIRYVSDIEDENEMDALFRELLAIRIGQVLAEPLTGSSEVAAAMKNEYEDKLRAARGSDGQEGSAQRMQVTSWVTARRTGVRGAL